MTMLKILQRLYCSQTQQPCILIPRLLVSPIKEKDDEVNIQLLSLTCHFEGGDQGFVGTGISLDDTNLNPAGKAVVDLSRIR
jgi:hypothetical protein